MTDAVQMGLQAAKAGHANDAVRWFTQAAIAQPANAQIRVLLGQTLCATGAHKDGVSQLHGGAVTIAHNSIPAQRAPALDLSMQLQAVGAVNEGIAVLDAFLKREPGNARAHYLRATGLAQVNRPADALSAAREAERRAPDNIGVSVLLVSLETEAGLSADAEKRAHRLLQNGLPPRETHRVLKELARLLDRKKDYDAAFSALEGAAVASAAVPDLAALDRALMPRLIAENEAGFTADLMARWRGHDFGDRAAPTFVMGFYRSGTTMTQQVLASHPQAFVSDEAGLIHAMRSELDALVPGALTTAAKLERLDSAGIARLRARYWAAALGRYGDAFDNKLFVDKFTLNTVDAGLISTIFPDGKLIFLLRDPRATCLSAFQQLMPPSPATAHLLTWRGTADFYAIVMRWWLSVRNRLSIDWIELRYEDVIADFTVSYTRALEFVGLEWDPALVRFHERASGQFISTPSRSQVAQPIYSTAVARWRDYERHYAVVNETLKPFVNAFGYDKS
jgi:tetratricopeptide (TPR) repeat protein